MLHVIRSIVTITALLALLNFDALAQSQSRTATQEQPFGNAFGSTKPTKTPNTPSKPTTPTPTAPNVQPNPLNDPQGMFEHLRDVTSAARTASPLHPATRSQGDFIRQSIGAKAHAPLLDPNAKVVDRLAPDPFEPLSAENSRLVAPQPNQVLILSAFIPTKPKARFERALRQLSQVKNEFKVQIGKVIAVGATDEIVMTPYSVADVPVESWKSLLSQDSRLKDVDLSKLTREIRDSVPPESELIKDLKLAPEPISDGDSLLKRFGITTVPAWIVEANGTFHVFEGEYEPVELFDTNGTFIAEKW